jgi:hypothetical protein
MSAQANLTADRDRIDRLERHLRALLIDAVPLPPQWRAPCLPVLGSIAEAVVEATLTQLGWLPYFDDDAGESHAPGVDLLMLDAEVERVVAIEVKSTVQPRRWPRLARSDQMTHAWRRFGSHSDPRPCGAFRRRVVRSLTSEYSRRAWCRVCEAGAVDLSGAQAAQPSPPRTSRGTRRSARGLLGCPRRAIPRRINRSYGVSYAAGWNLTRCIVEPTFTPRTQSE